MIDFSKLNVAPNKCFNMNKAPHKPVLLLSIIKLFEEGRIDLKQVELQNTELFETYQAITLKKNAQCF